MAINLQKGQTIDLRKNDRGESVYDLSSVTIGLGWDVRKKKGGFFSNIFSAEEAEFDLDAIAFLLDANGKVANLGYTKKLPNGQERQACASRSFVYSPTRHNTDRNQ